MKNQSINSEKKIHSIDLNTAKSPLNQPLAGKKLNNPSGKLMSDSISDSQEDHRPVAANHA